MSISFSFGILCGWNCWLFCWKSDSLGSYVRMISCQYQVRTGCKQICESRMASCVARTLITHFFISLQLLRRLPTIFERDRFPSWLAKILTSHWLIIMCAFSPFLPSYTFLYTFPLCDFKFIGRRTTTSFLIFCVFTNSL